MRAFARTPLINAAGYELINSTTHEAQVDEKSGFSPPAKRGPQMRRDVTRVASLLRQNADSKLLESSNQVAHQQVG